MRKLVVLEGPNRGVVFPLGVGTNRLGRDPKGDVTLPDRSISRRHALIEIEESGEAMITDAGSTNATYLNGLRVAGPRPIAHGDEIRLGDTTVLYLEDVGASKPGGTSSSSGTSGDTRKLAGIPELEPSDAVELSSRMGAARTKYMVGDSDALKRISDLVARCAPLDTTVLITGESGTGKELVAEALHRLSPRRSSPFLVINCATLEPALLESELFGHERGAFTGATARKLGKLEFVRGGTLFLDEIGELPLEAQAKLLRAIDRREFTRLGGHDVLTTPARFVAATHRDLTALVREGQFREDLLFRLRVVDIRIPPLRDRREDITPLVYHLLQELRAKIPTRAHEFTPEALDCLMRYPFPGNVRELRNIIERCLIFCDHDQIDIHDLPREVREAAEAATRMRQPIPGAGGGQYTSTRTPPPQPPRSPTATAPSIPVPQDFEGEPVGGGTERGGVLDPMTGMPIPDLAPGVPADATPSPYTGTLEELERTHIYQVLVATGWNKSKAAKLLAIDRNTLHAKIKRLGLAPA